MVKVKPKTCSRVAKGTVHTVGRDSTVVKCAMCMSLIGRCFPKGRFVAAPVGGRISHYILTFRRTGGNGAISVVYDNSTKICNVTNLVCRINIGCPRARLRVVPNIATTANKTTILNTPLVRSFYLVDLDSLLAP